MSATPSTVTRTDDPVGDTFATFDKDDGSKAQSVVIDPEVQGETVLWAQTGNAAAEQASIKAAPGRFFSAAVVLDPTVVSDRYLMVFNKASAPVNNDVPVLRALVPAGGAASIDLGIYGRDMLTGIAVAISTTPEDLTLPGSGEGFFQVSYY